MSEGRNFPEPKSAADRLLMKAAELVDQDIYGPVTEKHIEVRTTKIYIGNGAKDIVVLSGHDQDGGHYKTLVPNYAFKDIFWQAWEASIVRKKERLAEPFMAKLNNPNYEAELAAAQAAEAAAAEAKAAEEAARKKAQEAEWAEQARIEHQQRDEMWREIRRNGTIVLTGVLVVVAIVLTRSFGA